MELAIPGFGQLRLEHLVLDYNGTLALDGRPLPGVRTRLRRLARSLRIHVVTADTFGKARAGLAGLDCRLQILKSGGEDRVKAAYVRRLGPDRVACIGNGRNDRLMLRVAGLGIAVVQAEGAAAEALVAADLVAPTVSDALDLLLRPRRLLASLRS
ncbi:MAG: HAD hydrolase family protein [Burkholderiales bacterium]